MRSIVVTDSRRNTNIRYVAGQTFLSHVYAVLDEPASILHPINKPLLLSCASSTNDSLYIPYPKVTETDHHFQCGSKSVDIHFYGTCVSASRPTTRLRSPPDKPSWIRAQVYYTLPNEIGLKLFYPLEIVESVTVRYKIQEHVIIDELAMSPPLLNLRLRNLSCGSAYEIMMHASNQAGWSSTDYLIARTEGSGNTREMHHGST